MLLVTESVSSSPVSTRDIQGLSSYCNIPFTQNRPANNGSGASYGPAKISAAMAKVFVTVKDGQAEAPMRERELIEQSLAHWCNAGRTEPVSKHQGIQEMLSPRFGGDGNN